MTPTTTDTTFDESAIRDRFEVEILVPADERWDEARSAWNLAVDQHPAAVARPTNDAEVAAAIGYARDAGLRSRAGPSRGYVDGER